MRVALGLFLVLVAAACGDDGINRIPDNPPPPDGAMDGPPQPVTLTITDGATPREGVVVLFQNADSSLVARGMTDGSGVASAVMMPGGFVTAINPFGTGTPSAVDGTSLRTFAGVKPGDQLRLHQPAEQTELAITFVVPIDPEAATYLLWTSCGSQDITSNGGGGSGSGSGSGTPGGLVTLYGCGATIDLVIETRDASFEPLGAIVRTDVAVSPDMTIDLSSEAYAATVAQPLAYANVPGGFTTLNASYALVTDRGSLLEANASADLTAGAASAMFRRPDVPGATVVAQTSFFNGSLGRHSVIDWGAPGPYTFDGAGVFLREYASVPEFDVQAHKFGWTTSPGAQPDLVLSYAYFSRPDGKGSQSWSWNIAAPYTGDSLVFPVLPAEQAELNPAVDDTASFDELVMMKVPGGYDAVRANVLSLDERGLVVGASGRAVVENVDSGVELRRRGGRARLFPGPARRRAR